MANAETSGLPAELGGKNSYSDGPILAGPLLGEVSGTRALVWVQARAESPLTLQLFAEGASDPVAQFEVTPRAADWQCAVFTITGLAAGQGYEYLIRSEHGATPRYHLRAAVAADCQQARIAFGSCFHDYWIDDLPIFDAIGREAATALVLLGDNSYFDETEWPSESGMMRAHLRNRNHPGFRRLVSETSTLAIYDDHDFGPNDADGNFAGRDRALATFCRVWAQNTYGTADTRGIFSRVRVGPVELFLTDGRYYRGVGGKSLLGRGQLDWLLAALRSSQAPVKLIASGSTVLAHHPFYHDWESFNRSAPAEVEELLAVIERDQIPGVILLSGDLHMAQVRHLAGRRLGAGRLGPDFWDITSSPLANTPYNEHVTWPEGALIAQIPDRCNYGMVAVDLARPGAEILLLLKDSSGQELFRQAIPLASLQGRPG